MAFVTSGGEAWDIRSQCLEAEDQGLDSGHVLTTGNNGTCGQVCGTVIAPRESIQCERRFRCGRFPIRYISFDRSTGQIFCGLAAIRGLDVPEINAPAVPILRT